MRFVICVVFLPINECMMICIFFKRQVLGLTHVPLALITKAAPILSDDTYIDMMPVAWELLIESDQELAATAGEIAFLLPGYFQQNSSHFDA